MKTWADDSFNFVHPRWAGQFDSFIEWVNKASSWIDGDAVCIDAKGRRCRIGGDFMRARDEGAFPVAFFWDCEPGPYPVMKFGVKEQEQ